jgi:hypothetical protein
VGPGSESLDRVLWDPTENHWPCAIKALERAARARSGEQESAEQGLRLEAATCRAGQRPLLVARSWAQATERALSTGSAATCHTYMSLAPRCWDPLWLRAAMNRDPCLLLASHANSRIEIPLSIEMPIFLCPQCWADVVQRILRTSKSSNCLFYVCSEKRVRTWANSLFCGRDLWAVRLICSLCSCR